MRRSRGHESGRYGLSHLAKDGFDLRAQVKMAIRGRRWRQVLQTKELLFLKTGTCEYDTKIREGKE